MSATRSAGTPKRSVTPKNTCSRSCAIACSRKTPTRSVASVLNEVRAPAFFSIVFPIVRLPLPFLLHIAIESIDELTQLRESEGQRQKEVHYLKQQLSDAERRIERMYRELNGRSHPMGN
jgi:hypothetical protein